VAVGVVFPPQVTQVTLVLALVVFLAIWVAVQNFGGILAGGATDPNSGLPILLFALAYWPLAERRAPHPNPASARVSTTAEV
jgi:hypothetical protein